MYKFRIQLIPTTLIILFFTLLTHPKYSRGSMGFPLRSNACVKVDRLSQCKVNLSEFSSINNFQASSHRGQLFDILDSTSVCCVWGRCPWCDALCFFDSRLSNNNIELFEMAREWPSTQFYSTQQSLIHQI